MLQNADSVRAEMTDKTKDFDELLLSSIDEALLSIGESARESIFFHVEHSYNLSKNDIPANLDQFQFALEKIFGVGSRYLEILIMKNLYRRISQRLRIEQISELEFVKYVCAAKNSYMKECCE
jgi:hypothetical protein